MKRILLMVLRNLLFVPFGWIRLCYVAAHADRMDEKERFKILKYIDSRAIKGGNIKIESIGMENLPPEDEGYILFPNHQGMFDVLAIIAAFPNPIAVVAKKELKDIPFLKQVFAITKSIALDREDLREGMRVIQQVTKEVNEGRKYLIFAEGTRSKNGNHPIDFKGGSFKAATKAKCPIVPVALIDSYKAFDTDSIRQLTVKVFYLKPMLYEEYKNMKTQEIAEEVKRRIEEVIESNGGWDDETEMKKS